MERILIGKEWDQGYAFYAFKPKGYIDNFFARTSGLPGIGYDKPRRKWTAPAQEETLAFLKTTFGTNSLLWRGGVVEAGEQVRPASGQPAAPKPPPQDRAAPGRARQQKVSVSLPEHWCSALHRTEEQLKVLRYSWRTVKSYLRVCAKTS